MKPQYPDLLEGRPEPLWYDERGVPRWAEWEPGIGEEGYVVLSGYHSALYDELYADWPRVERATVADGARPRTEVLWISPRTWEALAREQGYLFQEVEDGR